MKILAVLQFTEYYHTWEKINSVTQVYKNGATYDIYKCSCGLIAHRLGLLETLRVIKGNKNNITQCPKAPMIRTTPIPGQKKKEQQIKITLCTAVGPAFENCKPNTIHTVIPFPDNWSERSKSFGVCIMGVGEPVKLNPDEYILV